MTALVAGLVAALVLLLVPAVERGDSAERAILKLRVVSLNLFHGGPLSARRDSGHDIEARLAMVIEQLRALRPDVIGLQEASAGRRRGNIAQRIATALDLGWVHAPSSNRVFGIPVLDGLGAFILDFVEGPAVATRLPILGSEIVDLPRCERFLDPRVLLRAELGTDWGPLQVFSTHTSRDVCQPKRVAELVRARGGRLPALLMGDFNAAEGSAAMTPFADPVFVDAFRVANPSAPGFTVWQRIDAPAPTVFRRVDYVFVSAGTEVAARVVGSRLVLDSPGNVNGRAVWPSDHYGVLADLELAATSPARERARRSGALR